MNAGGGFFGDALPVFDDVVEDGGLFGVDFFEEVFDDLFFVVAAGGVDPIGAVFEFKAFVDEEGEAQYGVGRVRCGLCARALASRGAAYGRR